MRIAFSDYVVSIAALTAFFMLLCENCVWAADMQQLFRMVHIIIFTLFIYDVVIRTLVSKNKKAHIKRHWFEIIVFLPVVHFIQGIESASFPIITRQIVILIMLISRRRQSSNLLSLLSLKPAQLMVVTFALAIGTGTVLLMLPAATTSDMQMSFMDALFTSTSATCVTGLIVQDTATYFSLFGQIVILCLMQIGGLGIMTFSVSLVVFMRKQFGLKRQIIMQDVLDQDTLVSAKRLIFFIFRMTFIFEALGVCALFFIWKDQFPNTLIRFYNALFHSVSAFCNAGFSTFSDSLARFSGDFATNAVICFLVIVGGIGFIVVNDLYAASKRLFSKNREKFIRFRVQTKIVLFLSVTLILLGAGLIYVFEYGNAFASQNTTGGIITALFHSISARTAGFNTVDIGTFSSASLFFIMMLMFVGASPGSTGGGVKTTTIAIIFAVIISGLRQKENVEIDKRTIPYDVIKKAITVLVFSFFILFFFTVLLLYVEQKTCIKIIFEAVSAFGTVGLSTGITSELSEKGKGIIILLMFIGRLGPLTVGYALMQRKKHIRYEYAEEKVMIG